MSSWRPSLCTCPAHGSPFRWPAFAAQMTFELYKDKSDNSPSQRESFLNRFTSSFIGPRIPKTYCAYQVLSLPDVYSKYLL